MRITSLLFSLMVFFQPSIANSSEDPMVCNGKGSCITEMAYQAYLNSPDYLCDYYAGYIWKESERPYGKKQYAYTEQKLVKIKQLKDHGVSLCASGQNAIGEEKLIEAIRIISFTPPAN